MLSDDTIRNHIIEYKEFKKLKPQSDESIEKLSFGQSVLLEEYLQRHSYLYVKNIVAYVEATFGIIYTVFDFFKGNINAKYYI
ncbi:MAG: hypothetical protein JW769_03615 [Parachlamydiales bacterium]|nr:hypothetical protein [Parachlamydiales bacterium]